MLAVIHRDIHFSPAFGFSFPLFIGLFFILPVGEVNMYY